MHNNSIVELKLKAN